MTTGGCLCGAIRYEIDQPILGETVCHCKNCQRQGGSAFSAIVAVRAAALKLTGDPKLYVDHGDSGAEVHRYFCAACGSPIYTSLPANPKTVFVKAGTLDDTSGLAPKFNVWCDSAWLATAISAWLS